MNASTIDFKGEIIRKSLLLLCLSILTISYFVTFPRYVEILVIIFSSSVCVVYLATPFTIKISEKFGILDHPGERHIHAVPTPRWGGIPVYLGVIIALIIATGFYYTTPNIKAIFIASTLILAVGLLDDYKGMPAVLKLAVQLLACIIIIADGIHVTFLTHVPGGIFMEWVITIIWIIGITNAINFLDGMDGLVSGLVAGTSLIYFALSLLVSSHMMAYCAIAILGSTLCFLSFNIKPARIFLGDSGSNFLGFYLATLSVQGGWAKNDPIVSLFIPILVLSVPIYDMTFTTIARIISGRVTSFKSWLEYTGRDHLHHRLEALGLSRGKVVLTIWFLNMGVGLGAITLFEARTYGGIALILQALCVYIILALLEVLGAQKQNSTLSVSSEKR
jgi:UDP-GlcNAc:undecaprenyl-phosphate GlcNAc-1-phosphate transferase